MTVGPETVPVFPASPVVRVVPAESPWLWLASGWKDFIRAPRASLLYGGGIAIASLSVVAMLDSLDRLPLLLPLLAGFALVSPFLAVGLYAISHALSAGKLVGFGAIRDAIRPNQGQIALMGALLMMIHLVWVRVATLLFALFFGRLPTGISDLVDQLLRTVTGFSFLTVGTVIGAALATFTFGISVVALPMLVGSRANVVSAIATSWTAVAANRKAMALWAAIIAGATLFGFATFFAGLIVVMPLLGYASWHAYLDLVAPPGADQADHSNLSPMEQP